MLPPFREQSKDNDALTPCLGALFPQDAGEHGVKILLKLTESIEVHLGSALQQQGTMHQGGLLLFILQR